MRVVVVVVALVAAGCIEPNLQLCGDGTACAPNQVCLPGGGCGTAMDIAACDGLEDGTVCTGTLGGGRCRAGACRVSRCGDGIIDGDEVCDDGNIANGDGCSGTCLSDETCGNGISELAEACDCGDADHPGPPRCANTSNGGAICRDDCTLAGCGNDKLDVFEVCDDGNNISGDGCNGTCTSLEMCGNTIVDLGEACDDGNQVSGDGCQPTCELPRCGDTFPDAGEVCDDGNNTPGDGCSFDCMSDETCGNSVVDYFAGETCDDGRNKLLHDGCTDACDAESLRWEIATPPLPPLGRHAHALAYDSTRKSLVVFGGMTGSFLQTSGSSHLFRATSETWEWDLASRSWHARLSTNGPAARFGHAMAYDAVRKKIVLFGGYGGTAQSVQTFGDTWEWDSLALNWTQRTPATLPPARGLHAMVFDPTRGRVVMFGGADASTFGSGQCGYMPSASLTDTWEWDGTDWVQRSPTSAPPAQVAGAMVWDSSRTRVVLLPGMGRSDIWEWDGSTTNGTWTVRAATSAPSRFGYAAAYDAARAKVVLFGGENWNTSGCGVDTASQTTATWDPSTNTWTTASPATAPTDRSHLAGLYDPARSVTVVFGGQDSPSYSGAGQLEYNDVWEWNGTTWARSAPATPPRLVDAAIAYDSERQEVVVFGGGERDSYGYPTASNETWVWNGASWVQRFPATSPSARYASAMTYDAGRQRVVLFGGTSGYMGMNDTWEWDGVTWTQKTFPGYPSPPARFGHTMAYDAAGGMIVMFGGAGYGDPGNASDLRDDAWTYFGNHWFNNQKLGPSARIQAAMVYDAQRERIVLFGGSTQSTYDGRTDAGDTWEWLGYSLGWELRATTGPAPRDRTVLLNDPLAPGVFMFGGRQSAGLDGLIEADTWRWDGTAWTSILLPQAPGARYGHAGVYDGARHEIVVAFGADEYTEASDTWTLKSAFLGIDDDDCSGGTDHDNDGERGCDDPDCWSYCTPACPPETSCPMAPRCGDGTCQSPRENSSRCPADCAP